MGRFPRGARIIPNPYNQIPGFPLPITISCQAFR
jgi:molybdopterin-biosynthesis enzyme MoeA-like protein